MTYESKMRKYRRENIDVSNINTWVNEFGDRIYAEKSSANGSFYIARNLTIDKGEWFTTLLSAKKYLNKIRKSKSWVESFE